MDTSLWGTSTSARSTGHRLCPPAHSQPTVVKSPSITALLDIAGDAKEQLYVVPGHGIMFGAWDEPDSLRRHAEGSPPVRPGVPNVFLVERLEGDTKTMTRALEICSEHHVTPVFLGPRVFHGGPGYVAAPYIRCNSIVTPTMADTADTAPMPSLEELEASGALGPPWNLSPVADTGAGTLPVPNVTRETVRMSDLNDRDESSLQKVGRKWYGRSDKSLAGFRKVRR